MSACLPDEDLEVDARRESVYPQPPNGVIEAHSPAEYDYTLIFIEEDRVGAERLHEKLGTYGLVGCMYDDVSICPAFKHDLETYEYAFKHSTVYLLYMSQKLCQTMRLFSRYGSEMFKHANYAALYKCLMDTQYKNLFIPYYPTVKKDLQEIPFHIAPIAGLEEKGYYYKKHLCTVFGLMSPDNYKTYRPDPSHPVQRKKEERKKRQEEEMKKERMALKLLLLDQGFNGKDHAPVQAAGVTPHPNEEATHFFEIKEKASRQSMLGASADLEEDAADTHGHTGPPLADMDPRGAADGSDHPDSGQRTKTSQKDSTSPRGGDEGSGRPRAQNVQQPVEQTGLKTSFPVTESMDPEKSSNICVSNQPQQIHIYNSGNISLMVGDSNRSYVTRPDSQLDEDSTVQYVRKQQPVEGVQAHVTS